MNRQDIVVGQALPQLRIEPISRKTLALFAGASGDHQPTHLDIDAARAKGRDDVIAHGMLVMAYMARMLTDLVPQDKILSYGARFVAVTPVHAEPMFSGHVAMIEGDVATLELKAQLSDGKLVAQGKASINIG